MSAKLYDVLSNKKQETRTAEEIITEIRKKL